MYLCTYLIYSPVYSYGFADGTVGIVERALSYERSYRREVQGCEFVPIIVGSFLRALPLCDKDYRITQIAREHPVGMIFHLSHSVFGLDYQMEYALPPQYAQPITEEDVEEVNSGRAEYTLRKRFVKDDGGEFMQHKGNFVRGQLYVIKQETFIE